MSDGSARRTKPVTDWSGKWHPLAERFPMLAEEELREMAASIREHGQFVPCRMDLDGVGLDGRNRVAACALAEVEPSFEAYEGDPISFIVQVNAERRHLSTGQRAMATAIGLVESGARSNGRFKRGTVPDNAGSRARGWMDAVRQAGLVLDHAPELADPVLAGDLALDAAHGQASAVKQQREQLEAVGGELAALVENGVIDVSEAQRRADAEARTATLPDDLAERVRDENLSLDEAEVIAAEHRERVVAWAQEISQALGTLGRMAGHPVPDGLSEHLSEGERAALAAVLSVLDEKKEKQ